jgi:5-methylcytosine-specific restriction endonuclease McrA
MTSNVEAVHKYRSKHRDYVRQSQREYIEKNREELWQRRREVKYEALMMLGGKCTGFERPCGITDIDVLEIDHVIPVNGKRTDARGTSFHRKIRAGKVPLDNLQILCANCHSRKTIAERRKEA